MSDASYTIYGGLGSPYSMKMRAVLRYRRLPHVWVNISQDTQHAYQHVKVPVIPILQYPDGTWHNDSTPMIFDLEQRHAERSVVPEEPAQAFLARLFEDMADEWGTKIMFHYRWFRERDQKQMSEWLVFDRFPGAGRDTVEKLGKVFRDRQVARMAIVGCTEANAPLIEETGRRVFTLFDAHVLVEPYLFGTRPSLADFAWMGPLSQLAVDPTPSVLMRETAPFLFRWLIQLDDASGVEGAWRDPDAPLSTAVRGLLELAGEVYLPFLVANAEAIAQGRDTLQTRILGHDYEQGVFKYQAKCLAELRRAFAALAPAARTTLESALRDTGCVDALRG